MGDMVKYPGLQRFKHRKWTVRVVVPLHLRSIVGKKEIWQSTGTGDHVEAKKKYPLIRAEPDAMLREAEQELTPLSSPC